MIVANSLRRTMHVSSARIVAQARPMLQYFVDVCIGKIGNGGENDAQSARKKE